MTDTSQTLCDVPEVKLRNIFDQTRDPDSKDCNYQSRVPEA